MTDNKIEQFNNLLTGLMTDVLRTKYKKILGEIMEKDLKNRAYEGTVLQEAYDKLEMMRKQEQHGKYYFITICPYEDVELSKLMKVMDKVVKKKWFTSYVYVYEQRQGDPNLPITGIHTHIIVDKGSVKKSEAIREVYNTCKDIVGSKQSIDVKLIETKYDFNVKLNYILGQKSTEEKRKKQIIDKVFREKNRIEPYYQNNFLHYIQEYQENAAKVLSPSPS